MKPRNFIFVIQGEGRGHLTQAMAVYDMLKGGGHTISCILVGTSSRREIPAFFTRRVASPVVRVPSPNFITDRSNKSINLPESIWKNLFYIRKYIRSIRIIKKLVEFHQPDIILNFFEPLVGLYAFLYKPPCKILSIAHQYLYLHEEFKFPKGQWTQQKAIKFFTRLTGFRSSLLIALSFYPVGKSKDNRLIVSPPILRRELFNLEAADEGFILLYLLNDGYMDEVIQWHRLHPDTPLHCFTDNPKVNNQPDRVWKVDETLSFHGLDDQKFLEMMGRCRGLVCTAGFESVCEALYLEKPILMVPVAGHYEQYCNARDANRVNAGIHDEYFNLDRFLEYLPQHKPPGGSYHTWVRKAGSILMDAIESLDKKPPPVNNLNQLPEKLKKVS